MQDAGRHRRRLHLPGQVFLKGSQRDVRDEMLHSFRIDLYGIGGNADRDQQIDNRAVPLASASRHLGSLLCQEYAPIRPRDRQPFPLQS